jgi:hypothetical protein
MKSWRTGLIVGVLVALLSAGTIRAELIFFDNFNQFPAGTDLTQTNYTPTVGASAEVETNETPGENSTTAVATNFLGSTWLVFATGTPPYQGLYQGVPTVTPISQVVTESFTLWIPSTTSTNNIGGLGLNLPSTNSSISGSMTNIDDEPIVFISDGGPIATFTNSPSPQSLLPIGNWSGLAATAMTNVLVINYSAGTFSFSLNGVVLTNMPIPSYITNFLDAVRLRVSEDISNGVYLSLGNTFALGDITVTTPTTSTNQDVAVYVPAAKIQFFEQTSSSNVVPLTAGFGFQASADGTGSNTILDATDQCPSGSNLVLTLSDPSISSFNFEQSFTTKSALDEAYTNGTYTITIFTADDGTLTDALGLPADDYPNTPQLLDYDAAQAIDASSQFDFVWGAFTNGTTNDFIIFEIDDVLGNTITNSPNLGQPGQLDGTATNFLIAGGTLLTGGSYTGRLEFIKITAQDTNTIAGAIGVTAYGEQIEFGLMAGATAVCVFAISPTNALFTAAGGSNSVSVTASNGCAWTAASNAGFITITSATNGTGDGTVSYAVATNANTFAQTGTMTIAGQTFTVIQSGTGCNFTLDSTNASFGAVGGSSNIMVTANGTNCAWTAVSNSGFITITAGSSGSGNGTVSYTVATNFNASAQAGSMTIAGLTYTITQAAAPCVFSLDSTNASFGAVGGSSNIMVTANGTNCAWTAVSNSGFITITSGNSGAGFGMVGYTVATNASTFAQIGSMTIAGQTFTVMEGASPCAFSLNSTSASFSLSGGSSNVVVTANGTNCAWTAASNSGFITITAGSSGTGNGTVSYTVATNFNAITQTGSMTIAGQTYTVTEAAGACGFSLNSTNASFGAAGGSNNVAVTANGPSCTWTAVSNSGFITITAGSSGTGNGTLSYSIASNANTIAQTGSMTIAGQTYTVTEAAAPCVFSLDSTNASFGADGGSTDVVVTANGTNCAWTAVSNSAFITITSATNGTGDGMVGYTVATNANTIAQTGSMTIAGQTYTVTEAAAPCGFSLDSSNASFGADGGSGAVAITANGTNCPWTAVSNSGFITITSATNGTGNGTVSYAVAANTNAIAQTGSMTIAGQPFAVDQAGATLNFEFTHVVQDCKTRINKKAETTNVTCTLAFDLVITNTGVTNTPKSTVLLWLEQGPAFSTQGPTPLIEKVKAFKENKQATIKIKSKKINGYLSGTYVFATDAKTNVLTSIAVPSP